MANELAELIRKGQDRIRGRSETRWERFKYRFRQFSEQSSRLESLVVFWLFRILSYVCLIAIAFGLYKALKDSGWIS